MKERIMYGAKGRCTTKEREEFDCFLDISPNEHMVKLYGHKEVHRLLVRNLKKGEKSEYYAWLDFKEGEPDFVYYTEGLTRMCAPDGFWIQEKNGKGKVINVAVEEMGE